MSNFRFDAISVFPSVQMGDNGSLIKNIQPRTFLSRNGRKNDTCLVRDRGKNEQGITMNGDKYFTTHIHLLSTSPLIYTSSLEPKMGYEIAVDNKELLVSLLHNFSALLGSLLQANNIVSVENEFRTIFEHALRSGMKVYREVSDRGRPFIFENFSFYDLDRTPVQIDDLATHTMPKVSHYFDKKIAHESSFDIQKRYQRFNRRFGEETVELFIQQTGTLGAELYHIWKHQLPLLNKEMSWSKN